MNFTNVINHLTLQEIMLDEELIIIDCRHILTDTKAGRQSYNEAHITGAIYAHLDEDLSGDIILGKTGRHPLPPKNKFERLAQSWGLESNKQVVVYDQGHGGIAARLWWMLRYWGHQKVAVLNGGWKNWMEHELPVTSKTKSKSKSNWQASVSIDQLMEAEEIMKGLDKGGHCLVDARAADRFQGLNETIDPVAGHIPGALSFPFLENLDANHLWKSKSDVKRRFESLMDQKKDLVFYCGSGVTACHNLLALEYAGLNNAKLYPGSWSDWITHKEYPIG